MLTYLFNLVAEPRASGEALLCARIAASPERWDGVLSLIVVHNPAQDPRDDFFGEHEQIIGQVRSSSILARECRDQLGILAAYCRVSVRKSSSGRVLQERERIVAVLTCVDHGVDGALRKYGHLTVGELGRNDCSTILSDHVGDSGS